MRKYLWVVASAALAVLVFAQGSPGQLLANYAKILSEAKSLKASYTVQSLNGAPQAYEIELAKPNFARIETPTEQITADGTTIVRYDKKEKTYFKDPQTDQALKELIGADQFGLWAAFFKGDAFSKATTKSLGSVNRRGMQLTAVEASFDEGKKTVVFYIAPKDNLAHQGEIGYADLPSGEKLIVNAKSIQIGGDVNAEQFAFKAPAGSRELTEEERISFQWYEDLEEAKKVAAKSKRLLFVDFGAVW